MDDLIAFLRARLDEDERIAKAASAAPWRANDDTYPEAIYAAEHGEVISGGRWGGEARCFDSDEDVWHIVRHDPARVLADVAAKREIIELLTAMLWENCYCSSSGSEHHDDAAKLLRLLALPYVDHPAYQENWKP